MNRVTEKDWSFSDIHDTDQMRAICLASCGSPDDLVKTLDETLNETIDCGELRIAVDSKHNRFVECRTIVQFRVSPEQYDWFFNARTSYRSRYWIHPAVGLAFNSQIVEALVAVLRRRLPALVIVRKIEVMSEDGTREDKDVGVKEITRGELLRSLVPEASKIWIGERLYSRNGGPVTDVGLATLSDAAQSSAKLWVPRWAKAINPKTGERGEGLRAPFPRPENSWLDLKGGFLDAEGEPTQIKPQDKRADHIYKYGWT